MQMRTWRLPFILSLLVLAALLAPAVTLAAQNLNAGTVLLLTPAGAGTAVDFSSNPIPAGFFCPGSAPFSGVVPLQGVPLATNPAGIAGGADTIVEHLTTGIFNAAGVANFSAVLRALRLRSSNNVAISCGTATTFWRVDVCACGPQVATTLSAQLDPACNTCGTASGTLSVNVCVTFTRVDTGQVAGPIRQNLSLNLTNSSGGTPWCFKPGQGEPVATQPFQVDTNCDNQPDLTVRPSANFHTGYTCATQGQDCLTLFASLTHCHDTIPVSDHLHCVNPICKPRQ